jgi:putative ribosome biogenesis GTPase RsgA
MQKLVIVSEWVDSLNKHFLASYMLKNNDSCSTATTTIATTLILFPEALAHLSRLMRILEQPGGHALLLGQSGVGKKSLTKLVVHVLGYSLNMVSALDSLLPLSFLLTNE